MCRGQQRPDGQCRLTLLNGCATSVDGRAAVIELEDRVNMSSGQAGAECFAEVKGAVTNTVTVTRIKVKPRVAPFSAPVIN